MGCSFTEAPESSINRSATHPKCPQLSMNMSVWECDLTPCSPPRGLVTQEAYKLQCHRVTLLGYIQRHTRGLFFTTRLLFQTAPETPETLALPDYQNKHCVCVFLSESSSLKYKLSEFLCIQTYISNFLLSVTT